VSRTRKDSHQNIVLEVVKKDDGTYDLFLNRNVHRTGISEDTLPRELCVRFGYCGEEYEEILRELNQAGKKKLFLSS
jgi:hypothetical protein